MTLYSSWGVGQPLRCVDSRCAVWIVDAMCVSRGAVWIHALVFEIDSLRLPDLFYLKNN